MPLRRPLAVLGLCAAASLLPAAGAAAAAFPGEAIDGPSADIVSVGGVDVSRDGSGAVAYVRRDGGVDHVFVSRLADGAWQPPERVDAAIAGAASSPVVAAGDGGRLVVAWLGAGTLWASVRADAAAGWSAPQPVGGPAEAPALDLGVNGHAYLVWAAGGDVRAARLERGGTQFTPLASPLDLDPARPAGDAPGRRPRVAVAADGVALVAFGEVFADGVSHVVARRLLGLDLSPVPQDLTVDQLDGRAGGAADQPDVSIEEDSSYGWVTFREAFAEGTRAVARHMRGTRFEPAVAVDGQGFPSEAVDAPRIALNGSGIGLTSVGRASGTLFGSALDDHDVFQPAKQLDAAPSPLNVRAIPVIAENDRGLVVWPFGTPGSPSPDAQLRGSELDKGLFQPEQPLSNPDLGPIDVDAGVYAATDRALDVAIVAIQGNGADRRLVATMVDSEPGNFLGQTSENWRRAARPTLQWAEAFNLWGPLTYTVEIDGRAAGTSAGRTWTPSARIPDGRHRWRVVATDRRGQTSSTRTRLLRVDATPPRLRVTFSGARRAGHALTIKANPSDPASGVRTTSIDFGDGTGSVRARSARHAFRAGRFTVRVAATDVAGNTAVVRRRITVKG